MPGNKSPYKIFYSSDVIKYDILKLDNKIKTIISRKIKQLEHEPCLGLPLKGKLARLYKLKVSKYRIVYQVDRNNFAITIIAIAKRSDSIVYELAEKRI